MISAVEALAITHGPRHHFFGFHDLVAWNHDDTRMIGLEVDSIDHPPRQREVARVGYIDMETLEWHSIASTCAFNYPQGARTQWLAGERNRAVFNNLVKNRWGCEIFDIDTGKKLQELSSPAHVATETQAFGLDYARLNRFGVYGYAALPDLTSQELAPENSGITVNDFPRDSPRILLSVKTVASFEAPPSFKRFSHYLTHLVLSPSRQRIAFLHRVRTGEGELTRLMTVGIDGTQLRLLGCGALSHFDWLDNEHIMIWGCCNSMAEKLRSSSLYALTPAPLLRWAKRMVKILWGKKNGAVYNGNMLEFADITGSSPQPQFTDCVHEDGHPMVNPRHRNWIICDNYPDSEGFRTLFLLNRKNGIRYNLGRFHILDDAKVDTSLLADAFAHVDLSTLAKEAQQTLAFFRSGFHCDLHPHWNSGGTAVGFDSIHDGSRQIYLFRLDDLIRQAGR